MMEKQYLNEEDFSKALNICLKNDKDTGMLNGELYTATADAVDKTRDFVNLKIASVDRYTSEKEVKSLTIKIQDSQIKENKYRGLINDFNKNFKNKPENISYDSTIVPDDIRSWLCTNSKGCL